MKLNTNITRQRLILIVTVARPLDVPASPGAGATFLTDGKGGSTILATVSAGAGGSEGGKSSGGTRETREPA